MAITNLWDVQKCIHQMLGWADLGDGWKNYATDQNYEALALTIQAQISGEDMPKDLWLYADRNVIVKKGTPCKFEFGVINLSPRVAHKLKSELYYRQCRRESS